MESSEVLIVIAEVAVAFAGFTGLIAAISRRGPIGRSSQEFVRLRIMLDYSLLAILFALLPFLPHAAGVSGSTLWQVSSAIWFVGAILYAVLHHATDKFWSRGTFVIRRVIPAIETVVIASVGLNALSWPFESGFFVYLVALFWYLAGAAIGFVQFVSLIWGPSTE